jgi:hypothetical protein
VHRVAEENCGFGFVRGEFVANPGTRTTLTVDHPQLLTDHLLHNTDGVHISTCTIPYSHGLNVCLRMFGVVVG